MEDIVMEVAKEKEEKKKKTEKTCIAKLAIRRTLTGITINIKSKTLEEFFKSAYGGETAVVARNNWAMGERYYKGTEGNSPLTVTSERYTINFNLMENNMLVTGDEHLNLSFMRIKGIGEGKTFNFPGLYRETDVAAIAQSINEAMKNLFKEYNTPACYEIELNAEK